MRCYDAAFRRITAFLHLIHKNPTIRNTPFIFMRAPADRAEMRKGMELGADDYIIKPFEKTELLQAIECRLKRAEWLKQEFVQRKPSANTNGHACKRCSQEL